MIFEVTFHETRDDTWSVYIPRREEHRTPIIHTDEEWQNLLLKFDRCCARCGRYGPLTRDHIVPISRGGTDEIENIQPLCWACNQAKGNKLHG